MHTQFYFKLADIDYLKTLVPAGSTLKGVLISTFEATGGVPTVAINYIDGGGSSQLTITKAGCPYPPPCSSAAGLTIDQFAALSAADIQNCLQEIHDQLQTINDV